MTIYLQIKAMGSYLPEHILTNADLEKMVDTSDEWIVERTGIKQRYINKENTAAYMASQAAAKALSKAEIAAGDLDMIIATTITPDFFTPSMACMVQKDIGAENAFCFDINAACSGFVYALDIANAYIKGGAAKNILIVSSEQLSRITDYTDRGTCILFGDGAAATVVVAGEKQGLVDRYIRSIGKLGDVLECASAQGSYITMNGREVYKFAVSASVETIKKLMKDNDLTFDDIKYIIPHQANQRINEAVSAKLKCPPNIFYSNIEKYGNTSSASIPICLDELESSGKLKAGDKIIIVGFGGGLTFAGALIEWQ
jgi:3-oxoacyl-[acyl-carrier-protein] synthase-3